jgi:hypothetical protein
LPPEHAARLLDYALLLPSQASVDAVLGCLHTAGSDVVEVDWKWEVLDPSANRVVLRQTWEERVCGLGHIKSFRSACGSLRWTWTLQAYNSQPHTNDGGPSDMEGPPGAS